MVIDAFKASASAYVALDGHPNSTSIENPHTSAFHSNGFIYKGQTKFNKCSHQLAATEKLVTSDTLTVVNQRSWAAEGWPSLANFNASPYIMTLFLNSITITYIELQHV